MHKQGTETASSATGSAATAEPRKLPFKPALALVAAAWIMSDAGYYLLLPLFGLRTTYNLEPVAIALYYSVWIAIAVPVFWPLYRRWPTADNPAITHIILIGLLGGIALFAVHGLPALPRVVWRSPGSRPN